MRVFEANAPAISAVANGIAQSQTPGGAGDLTLNGSGVATYPYFNPIGGPGPGGASTSTRSEARFNPPRQVTITTAADESGKTFTIYGTDRAGISISETMTGPSTATGTTVKIFASVTRIAVSAATTGAITAGWGAVSYTRWIGLGNREGHGTFRVLAIVTGTVNYDIEVSAMPANRRFFHDVGNTSNTPGTYAGGDQMDDTDNSLATGKTANFGLDLQNPYAWVRVKKNSGTGSVRLRVLPNTSN